ncbi:hypothetical protein HYZ41_02285 [archaeon]|nr:hypothetical protein [archaeon]
MKFPIKMLLLLAVLVFVAGCTSLPFVPGSDVIKMVTTERAESPQDAVIIQKAQLSPSSSGNTIFPDQAVTLLFNIVNKDDTKSAVTKVEMFNAPSFRSTCGKSPALNNDCPPCTGSDCPLCNSGNACKPNVCNYIKDSPTEKGCTLLPAEEKQVSIEMKSPLERDIASTITKTKIEFRATYNFVASLVYIIPVVNIEEVKARQRGNEKTEVQLSKMQGSGPVRVGVDLVGPPYILANQPTIMTFKLKNVGSGNVVNSKILPAYENGMITSPYSYFEDFLLGQKDGKKAEGFIVKFPGNVKVVEAPGCKIDDYGNCNIDKDTNTNNELRFQCNYDGDNGETICYSASNIELFRGETLASMRFRVQAPVQSNTPFTSYTILAYAGYNYEIRDSIETTINPFYNVG